MPCRSRDELQLSMSTQSKSVIVGTAGHIDHGKSALVEGLTGTHPDRLAEEKRRGITIDLGFAFLEENGVRFGLVDVPGHERFVSNMLAGAAGVDLLLLVIAADESIKPQTREHFDICRLLGVKRGVGALTTSELVVTGTLMSASLAAGEEVELFPLGKRLRVRGVQSGGKTVDRASAGQRTAVNLAGIEHTALRRGMVLATPGKFRTTRRIDIRLELLPSAPKLKQRSHVHFHS